MRAVQEAAPGRGLDTHRERSDPAAPEGRWGLASGEPCERSNPRLALSNGEGWTWVRCKNRRCRSCDTREALELARVLKLDALVRPVEAVMVLTTQDPADSHRAEKFRRAFEQVCKALRRRWPAMAYLSMVEFTTGTSARSGGFRRMHTHVLLRGLAGVDLREVEKIAARVWCSRMSGTQAVAQRVEAIRSHDALVSYLAHHHRKPGQQPPDWWTGKRTRSSRNWWSRPIAELRQEAREQLRLERLWFVAHGQAAGRLVEHMKRHECIPGVLRSRGWEGWVGQVLEDLLREAEKAPPWRLWHLGSDREGQPRPWLPVPVS